MSIRKGGRDIRFATDFTGRRGGLLLTFDELLGYMGNSTISSQHLTTETGNSLTLVGGFRA
jgi:hypothetical protein